jgi:hypothetical protein
LQTTDISLKTAARRPWAVNPGTQISTQKATAKMSPVGTADKSEFGKGSGTASVEVEREKEDERATGTAPLGTAPLDRKALAVARTGTMAA